jgi:hypothetical protein
MTGLNHTNTDDVGGKKFFRQAWRNGRGDRLAHPIVKRQGLQLLRGQSTDVVALQFPRMRILNNDCRHCFPQSKLLQASTAETRGSQIRSIVATTGCAAPIKFLSIS